MFGLCARVCGARRPARVFAVFRVVFPAFERLANFWLFKGAMCPFLFFVLGVYLAFVLGLYYCIVLLYVHGVVPGLGLGAVNGPPLSPCVYVFVVCVSAAMMIFSTVRVL